MTLADHYMEEGRQNSLIPEGSSSFIPEDGFDKKTIRKVSMKEANAFIDMKKKNAPVFANATSMCILSPVPLVILGTLADSHMLHITDTITTAVGCTFLFAVIALAVYLYITCGMHERFSDRLQNEVFETEPGVSDMVDKCRAASEEKYIKGIALGVVLCILSVIPVILAGAFNAPDYIAGLSVALLLLCIASGVNMLIRVGIIRNSYDTLLQEGEYSKAEKKARTKMTPLSGVYWCLATALYLALSFLTMRWDTTWIIWPLAGVLYSAVFGIARIVMRVEE